MSALGLTEVSVNFPFSILGLTSLTKLSTGNCLPGHYPFFYGLFSFSVGPHHI